MKTTPPYIARHAALVERGLPVLTAIELKVWLVFERHANVDGIAYPSVRRIARFLGHTRVRHIKQAIRRLRGRGFLELVTRGGGVDARGHGRTTRYRVRVPETVPESDTVQRVSESGMARVPDLGAKSAGNGPGTVPDSDTGTTHELPNEQPKLNGDDDDDEILLPESERIKINKGTLDDIGIIGRKRDELARIEKLVPWLIHDRWQWVKTQPNVRQPRGLLYRVLRDDVTAEERETYYRRAIDSLRMQRDRKRDLDRKIASFLADYEQNAEEIDAGYEAMKIEFAALRDEIDFNCTIQQIVNSHFREGNPPVEHSFTDVSDKRAIKAIAFRAHQAGTYASAPWYPRQKTEAELQAETKRDIVKTLNDLQNEYDLNCDEWDEKSGNLPIPDENNECPDLYEEALDNQLYGLAADYFTEVLDWDSAKMMELADIDRDSWRLAAIVAAVKQHERLSGAT